MAHVTFVGRSGSGKTTLIERLLPLLIDAGLNVGVVKHTHHAVEIDAPGKDSWRFSAAGARGVVLITPEKVHIQWPNGTIKDEDLDAALSGCDLIIHEGDRSSPHPKVLIGEQESEARARGTVGEIVGVIGADSVAAPVFDRDDLDEVAALLIRYACARSQLSQSFDSLLDAAVRVHGHLCPGQVLGVRMAMRGICELGLSLPAPAKRLMVFVENDRCAADALASVSGCSLGKRSLRFLDFGKMAATFVDLDTERAVRVSVRDECRDLVGGYAPGIEDRHAAQTAAYRVMPDSELLRLQNVLVPLGEIELPGAARGRTACDECGEQVAEGRSVVTAGGVLCRPCSGEAYYRPLGISASSRGRAS